MAKSRKTSKRGGKRGTKRGGSRRQHIRTQRRRGGGSELFSTLKRIAREEGGDGIVEYFNEHKLFTQYKDYKSGHEFIFTIPYTVWIKETGIDKSQINELEMLANEVIYRGSIFFDDWKDGGVVIISIST